MLLADRPDAESRRRELREAGKDDARAYLLRCVKRGGRVLNRDRILAAKALLYEKAEFSKHDSEESLVRGQREAFRNLFQALQSKNG